MARFDTLHALLAAQAREDRQITFVDGEDDQRVLAFARLKQRALGLLGALQRLGLAPGHAMVLSVADNERFLEMFWACVLGGLVPVPLAPLVADEQRRKLLRIWTQFERVSLYIDGPSLERLEAFVSVEGSGVGSTGLRSHALIPGSLDLAGAIGHPRPAQPDDLAFIQYSSGSTGDPKGVLLTHRNLCANIASIAEAAAFSDRDVALSWMPLSHDMGLIGFHLNMVACGVSHVLMRTELFARRPLLWLELASRKRATVLCSPNFGYQHYLKQFAIKAPQGLDLSAVRLVFNGAEPISGEVCRRFAKTLGAHGLKPNSLFPVYGLAEASLAVSFPRPGDPLETLLLDPASLRVGEPVTPVAPGAGRAAEYVKLGRPVPGTELRIADASGCAAADGSLGRVWIRGENVTQGYHRDPERSAACLTPDGWLDTGDLGLIADGQLVITGRAKELIIVNGQNHHPHDLERIAEQVAGIEANRVAAASVRRHDADTEALAIFVVHRGPVADFVETVLSLRRTILQQTGLETPHVVPVRQIPKTSSGKLQRFALAQAMQAGEFDGVLTELDQLMSACEGSPSGDPASLPTVQRLQDICAKFVTDRPLTPQSNLLEIDLNSLTLARIHEAIEREFPQRVDVTDLFEYPTLEGLAAFLDRGST